MAQHTKRPYMLPTTLRADAELIERYDGLESISGGIIDTINKYITLHEQHVRRYEYLEALYKGFHSIYDLPEKPDWKPDHRLAVNFPRYMTETFTGYGYGIPIKVTYPGDDQKSETINEAVQGFGRGNEINDHNAEMVKRTCIYGHAFEYVYQNEDKETKITACDPIELFVVYDESIRERALFAIRYWYKDLNNDGYDDAARAGELMTRNRTYYFEDGKVIDMAENPYGLIPVVEWRLNDERIGLYEEVANLIETYNMTLGEKANDVDAFAEAYMAIIGSEVDEEGVRRIRDDRVINIYGTDDAKNVLVHFLAKPVADGSQENLLNRLEDLIYETSMVANISDESFGNAASGVALRYKLQAMSNLAMSFDRKIEKSLKKRYKIFCSLPTNVSDPEAYKDLQIVFTRNLPANISEEIDAAKNLAGIVSKETQLARLSFVEDVKAEIEKQTEENDAEVDRLIAQQEKISNGTEGLNS